MNDDINLDEQFQRDVDERATEDRIRARVAPQGGYTTDPDELGEFRVTPRHEDGRTTFFFVGRAKHMKEDRVASLRFTISPDPRPRRNADGEELEGDDKPTQLYDEAFKAYKTTHDGASPKRVSDIVEFLQQARYRITTWLPDDGDELKVTHLYALSKGRK